MPYDFFNNIFRNAPIPVIICRNEKDCPIVLANASARILLDPLFIFEGEAYGNKSFLRDLLRFRYADSYQAILQALLSEGSVKDFKSEILTYEDKSLMVSVSANLTEFSEERFLAIYLYVDLHNGKDGVMPAIDVDNIMSSLFHAANSAAGVDDSINKILGIAGSSVGASRAYVFEQIENDLIRNTYEWRNHGVAPAIQDFQAISPGEYSHSLLTNGLYIAGDIRTLPENERSVLEPRGIKALVVLPVYHGGEQQGYIGFDDCENYRRWSSEEIRLLQNVPALVSSLIARRKEEEKTRRGLEILLTISNNIDHAIYVNTIDTYEIIFVNQPLADMAGCKPEDIIGNTCWNILQLDKNGQCDFCPISKMIDEKGNIINRTYCWEFQNTLNGRWYMIKDSIIPWVDGKNVHMETALDITDQKNHEEQLQHIASIDNMTGTFNREWGYNIMRDMRAEAVFIPQAISLVFIDLDGLKTINDNFGHDAGDDMIIRIVETIRAGVRKSDVICRWGGDEFIVLLRCDTTIAHRLMQNIQKEADAFNKTKQKPYRLSFSYGIQDLTSSPTTPIDNIISEADRQMYKQKMSKR